MSAKVPLPDDLAALVAAGEITEEVACRRARKRLEYERNKDVYQKRSSEWRAKNRLKIEEYNRAHYAANREERCSHQREWYADNKEKRKDYNHRWREANMERALARSRNWYTENKDRHAENCRKWRAENPERVSRTAARHDIKQMCSVKNEVLTELLVLTRAIKREMRKDNM